MALLPKIRCYSHLRKWLIRSETGLIRPQPPQKCSLGVAPSRLAPVCERCIADSGLRCSTKRPQKTFDGFSFDLELIGPEDKIDEHIRSLKRP